MEKIDPRVTEADRKYLRMSPKERQQHLAKQGYAFPPERTDEQVIAWFKSLGPIGEKRLELASAIQAPPNLGIDALSWWHQRACELLGAKSPKDVTILTA
jgi:hypothetical protein